MTRFLPAIALLCLLIVSCSPKNDRQFLTTDLILKEAYTADKTDPCAESINYAPSEQFPSHTPMRYINLRFHVMRASEDDPHTFDTVQARAYVKDLLKQANDRLGMNVQMNLPVGNTTPVLPFRYRYLKVEGVHGPQDDGIDFHYDKELAYFVTGFGKNGHGSTEAFQKYGDPNDNALDVFMFEHNPDSLKSPTYKAKSTGTGYPQWFRLTGAKQFYDTIYHDGWTSTTPRSVLMNHEIGHTLGLAHTWGGHDGCDDTPPHPNCWDGGDPRCRDSIQSNNMMDYNNVSLALTPCQLGKIHYNFSRLESTQRKVLKKVWCTYHPEATIWINHLTPVVWNSSKDLNSDVVVTNGSTLVIQCRVSLPKGARIIVKPKAKLILDGATLTNLCGDEWAGIEVHTKGNETGRVIFSNDPVLEHMANKLNVPGS